MSEPYSLIIDLPISAETLRRALVLPSRAVSDYDDWHDLGLDLPADYLNWPSYVFTRNWSAARYLTLFREGVRGELGWMFRYDPQAERLLCIILLWTENRAEIIAGLAALRTLGEAAKANTGQPGHILVHDFVFLARDTGCGVIFEKGRSQLVAGTSARMQPLLNAVAPTITTMLEQAEDVLSGELADEPDTLLIDHSQDFF